MEKHTTRHIIDVTIQVTGDEGPTVEEIERAVRFGLAHLEFAVTIDLAVTEDIGLGNEAMMVLDDHETYSALENCSILVVPLETRDDEIDDFVRTFDGSPSIQF